MSEELIWKLGVLALMAIVVIGQIYLERTEQDAPKARAEDDKPRRFFGLDTSFNTKKEKP